MRHSLKKFFVPALLACGLLVSSFIVKPAQNAHYSVCLGDDSTKNQITEAQFLAMPAPKSPFKKHGYAVVEGQISSYSIDFSEKKRVHEGNLALTYGEHKTFHTQFLGKSIFSEVKDSKMNAYFSDANLQLALNAMEHACPANAKVILYKTNANLVYPFLNEGDNIFIKQLFDLKNVFFKESTTLLQGEIKESWGQVQISKLVPLQEDGSTFVYGEDFHRVRGRGVYEYCNQQVARYNTKGVIESIVKVSDYISIEWQHFEYNKNKEIVAFQVVSIGQNGKKLDLRHLEHKANIDKK